METEQIVPRRQRVNPQFCGGKPTLPLTVQIKTLPEKRSLREQIGVFEDVRRPTLAVIIIFKYVALNGRGRINADIKGFQITILHGNTKFVSEGQVGVRFIEGNRRKGERFQIVGGVLSIHFQNGVGVRFCPALF